MTAAVTRNDKRPPAFDRHHRARVKAGATRADANSNSPADFIGTRNSGSELGIVVLAILTNTQYAFAANKAERQSPSFIGDIHHV